MTKAKTKKDVVRLPIECCNQCTLCSQQRYYTADSFEHVTAWGCNHPKWLGKKCARTDREAWESPPGIARQDWHDDDPPIPEWCPLREKKGRA